MNKIRNQYLNKLGLGQISKLEKGFVKAPNKNICSDKLADELNKPIKRTFR